MSSAMHKAPKTFCMGNAISNSARTTKVVTVDTEISTPKKERGVKEKLAKPVRRSLGISRRLLSFVAGVGYAEKGQLKRDQLYGLRAKAANYLPDFSLSILARNFSTPDLFILY